jgi:hypothetical protein
MLAGWTGRWWRWSLPQHTQVRSGELGPRFDTEFIDQPGPGRRVQPQRLGLLAGGGQGEHQVPDQPLPQRVGVHLGTKLADERAVLGSGEHDLAQFFVRRQPALLQIGHRRGDERARRAGQRRSPPQ